MKNSHFYSFVAKVKTKVLASGVGLHLMSPDSGLARGKALSHSPFKGSNPNNAV